MSAGCSRSPAEATGVALILVDESGENSIAVAGGANAALGSVQVRTALKRLALTREDVVLVGHEIRTGATHEALRLGRIAGATTILNPAPATGLEPPTLALADVLTPNRGELAALAGADGRASVQAKRLLGPEPGLARGAGQSRRGRARCWSRPVGRGRSTRRTSSRSTRSGPATRSTGRWRRRWRTGSTSRSRLVAPSSPRRWRSRGRARARGCRRWSSSRRALGRLSRVRSRCAGNPGVTRPERPPRPRPRPSWPVQPASSRRPIVPDPPRGETT